MFPNGLMAENVHEGRNTQSVILFAAMIILTLYISIEGFVCLHLFFFALFKSNLPLFFTSVEKIMKFNGIHEITIRFEWIEQEQIYFWTEKYFNVHEHGSESPSTSTKNFNFITMWIPLFFLAIDFLMFYHGNSSWMLKASDW